jgi:hypothetical protein
MKRVLGILAMVLVPAVAVAEIIELKCTGEKYVYNAELKPKVNENTVQVIVINTKTRKMDIIAGVKSKSVRYTDDKNIIHTRFVPDVFILDDKILYEDLSLNRYTGEIISSYQFKDREALNLSFVGICEPTKRKF